MTYYINTTTKEVFAYESQAEYLDLVKQGIAEPGLQKINRSPNENELWKNDRWQVDFSALQNQKKAEIRKEFEKQSTLTATVDSVIYHGGRESAARIDDARRLNELAEIDTVNITDVNNITHTLTMQQVKKVILTIGQDYQKNFAKKQAALRAIDAAKTQQELAQVTYD